MVTLANRAAHGLSARADGACHEQVLLRSEGGYMKRNVMHDYGATLLRHATHLGPVNYNLGDGHAH